VRLVVIEVPGLPSGMQQRQEFNLEADPARPHWVIGRQMGSDIHLIDPSVSRTHAEVALHPEGVTVRDLGSANGTFINERQLLPLSPTVLRPGERLRVGNVVTLLEAGPLNQYNAATQVGAAGPGYAPGPNAGQPQSPRGQLPPTTPLNPDYAFEPPYQPPVSYNNFNAPAPGPVYPSSASYQPLPQQAPAPEPRYEPPIQQNREAVGNYQPAQAYPGGYDPGVNYRPAAPVKAKAAPLKPQPKAKGGPRWGIILLVLVFLLAALGAGGYALWTLVLNPTAEMPAAIFKSPAHVEQVLGVSVSRPSAWQRTDPTPSQVLFYRPENTKTVLNIEQPPSPSIVDGNYSPERAIQQYVANVKANTSSVQIEKEPAATKLKDGTAAVLTRLIFSTDGTKVAKVSDYHLLAISFRCGKQLYFVSAAAESQEYNANRQDIEASIANLTCSTSQG
jgi:hypothetical protein